MKQIYILLGGAVAVLALLFAYSFFFAEGPRLEDAYEAASTEDESSEMQLNDNQAQAMNVTGETTTVIMKTNRGDITLELFTGAMPITAGNFLTLAKSDFYDGVKFHRVIDGFMIQGGDPLTKDDSKQAQWGTGGPGYSIEDEFGQGLSNVPGTIAMANAGPNTGGSQFFINVAANTFLDTKHPVFGRVTGGLDVVSAIVSSQTGARDVPVEPIVIEDIVVAAGA